MKDGFYELALLHEDDAFVLVRVHLSGGGSRIKVNAYPQKRGAGEVEFYLTGNNDPELRPSIGLLDLVGNSQASGLRYQGLGTLVVNTGLAFARATYPAETFITATMGDPSDFHDGTDPVENQRIRARFWERFGFEVTRPRDAPANGRLSGVLGRLYPVATTRVLGALPAAPPIHWFVYYGDDAPQLRPAKRAILRSH